MKVFVKKHPAHAGKWIYEGYKNAWNSLGYDTEYYNSLDDIRETDGYYLMATDYDIKNEHSFSKIKNAKRSFVHVQPNAFPRPWGNHPNFISNTSSDIRDLMNEAQNVHLWSFSNDASKLFYNKWKDVLTLPLAYDNISYKEILDDKYKFDICFIGGWADNGFNEKRKIMLDVFSKFKDSGLKCGFFVNKNISHNLESKIIYNSKICLNIHDAYQRKLGFDTNERTFKCLGLNGLLVSDSITQLEHLFPNTIFYKDSDEIVEKVYDTLSKSKDELENEKANNKQLIEASHTYIKRTQNLLELDND